MIDSSDPKSCCCSCILTIIAGVIVLLAVLWQTKFNYHVKMFLYLWCLIVGGFVGGLISLPFGRSTNNHFRMFKVYQTMCSFMRLDFKLRNKHHIVSDKPFIIIANHQSALDVLGMTLCWPENCVVMLKSSLKYLPGFNLCAYLCNSIWIDRFSKQKSHKTMEKTLDAITNHQRKIWIYPEGTRNPGDTLLPFKKGAFILAKQAKIPIVCCVFSSHKFFYDWSARRFDKSGEILVDFLPPIDSNKFETIDELSDHCREIMQKKFSELNEELRQSLAKKSE